MKTSAAANEGEIATLQRPLEATERGWKTSREMRENARWPLTNCLQNARIQISIQCMVQSAKSSPHWFPFHSDLVGSAVSFFPVFVAYAGFISEFSRSVNSLFRAILPSHALLEKSSTHARSSPAGVQGSPFRLRAPPRSPSSFSHALHHRMPRLAWCRKKKKCKPTWL